MQLHVPKHLKETLAITSLIKSFVCVSVTKSSICGTGIFLADAVDPLLITVCTQVLYRVWIFEGSQSCYNM